MRPYNVTVRNEITGELTTLSVAAHSALEAQTDALTLMFRRSGWRRATASCSESTEHGWAADYQRFLDGARAMMASAA